MLNNYTVWTSPHHLLFFVSMSVNKPFSAILPIRLRVYGKLTFVLSCSFLFFPLLSPFEYFWGSLNNYLRARFLFFLLVARCRIIIGSDCFHYQPLSFPALHILLFLRCKRTITISILSPFSNFYKFYGPLVQFYLFIFSQYLSQCFAFYPVFRSVFLAIHSFAVFFFLSI